MSTIKVDTAGGNAAAKIRIDSPELADAELSTLTRTGTPVVATVRLRDDGPLAGVTDAERGLPAPDRPGVTVPTTHSAASSPSAPVAVLAAIAGALILGALVLTGCTGGASSPDPGDQHRPPPEHGIGLPGLRRSTRCSPAWPTAP